MKQIDPTAAAVGSKITKVELVSYIGKTANVRSVIKV